MERFISYCFVREKIHKYISLIDIADNIKWRNYNTMFNHDYQNYKQTFNKGLNFRIFSKDKTKGEIHKGFYILKVPEDKATQAYFKVEL